MTTFLRAIFLLVACSWFACGADPAQKAGTEGGDTWLPPKYTKVVGYRFDYESGDGRFSLISNGRLDTNKLAQIATGSVTLASEQVAKLTSALNSDQSYGFVACYDPHHIFVFYSETGAVVAAIEICFKCRGLVAIPSVPESFVRHHDLIALARLVDSLGLWQGKKSCVQWVSEHEAHLKDVNNTQE